jgi:hypothetical protein
MKRFYLLSCLFVPFLLPAQTNILTTNPLAEQILLGNYNATAWTPAQPTTLDPAALATEINARISPDSLKAYVISLSRYHNRSTGSDTVSAGNGIGASRRWVYQKFQEYSAANQNRLVVSYLQFDQTICNFGQHRNIMAILPGSKPAKNGVILVEGHIDSRCATLCDTACLAQGIEDNASGTALVMELARTMARYQFANTIVFMVTIGEEQGLYGAYAFADYIQQKGIPLRAVQNNDVIGGIICGQTSSAPSCPGLNNIDSTSVRLFSAGSYNSPSKQLARFVKLEYTENLLPTVKVPMNVRIMSPEDRTGRGGDHIPFREKNYPAMRFTSANEHGDASNGPTYTDRQHSSRDILGVDTNADGTVDSFYVDFDYLARNAVINANALAIAARGLRSAPDFTAIRSGSTVTVTFNAPIDTFSVRVALRSATNDWDTVFVAFNNATTVTLPCKPTGGLFVSACTQDAWGAESLFSVEKIVTTSGTSDQPDVTTTPNIRLFQNRPNPFDEATWISFWVEQLPAYQEASIRITDMQGRLIRTMPATLHQGMNEMLYTHGYNTVGTYVYTLVVDGKPIDSKQMVFAW